MRLALPKGRALGHALAALAAAGIAPGGLGGAPPAGLGDVEAGDGDRRLWLELPGSGHEALLLKTWDVPRYVERGIADCGFVGSDVQDEVGGDLLAPVALTAGRCRMSLIGLHGAELPAAGGQARLATKYPRTARRLVADRPWGAEIVPLAGSVELAPLLDLADYALDIVETGATLRAHALVELETVAEVVQRLVVNRAAFHHRRDEINDLIDRLEAAGVAE